MTVAHAVLLGSDHTVYGEVEVRAVAPDLALGITRGRLPKSYRFVDPNEDVVAAVVGPRATLLAVADGHNGFEASDIAVATVLERLGDDPPPTLPHDGWVEVFHAAGEAVLGVTRRLAHPNRESRTTLTVALVAEGEVAYGSMGDSSLFVASARSARELTRPAHVFVGYPMTLTQVAQRLDLGGARVGEGEWVVLASDGYTNFVRGASPSSSIPPLAAQADDAAALAEKLIRAATDGGAGDNVAVVVHGPFAA